MGQLLIKKYNNNFLFNIVN